MPFSFWATDAEADENASLLTQQDFLLGDNSQQNLLEHMQAKGLVSVFANHEQVAAALVGESGFSPQQVVGMIASYDSYADLAQAVAGKKLQPPEAHVVEPTSASSSANMERIFGDSFQGPGLQSERGAAEQARRASEDQDAASLRTPIVSQGGTIPKKALAGAPADIRDRLRDARRHEILVETLKGIIPLDKKTQTQLKGLAKTNPNDLLDVLGKAYFPDGRADVARQKASRMIDALNGHGQEGVTPSVVTVDAWFKDKSQANPFEPAVAKIIANSPADMKQWVADFDRSAQQATQAIRSKTLAAKLAARRKAIKPKKPDPTKKVDVPVIPPFPYRKPAPASGAARGDSQSQQGQGRHKALFLDELNAAVTARGESGKVIAAIQAGKAAVIATPTAPPMPPAASTPPSAPAVHGVHEVVPPAPTPGAFWAQKDSEKGFTLHKAKIAIASGSSGADTDRKLLKRYVENQTAAFLKGRPNASSVQSDLVGKLGFPTGDQKWDPSPEHIKFAETLDLIRTPRQLEAAVAGRFDAKLQQRCHAVASGKYKHQKDGWHYVTESRERLSLVDEAAMRYGHGEVYAITANPNDPLNPMKEHEGVAWEALTIGETTIPVPEAECKTIAAYMEHAKTALDGDAWTPENQQKAFARAMLCVAADRGQKPGTDYADVCQHYVDTAGDKPWVMTPEMRRQLGVSEQFDVDTAKKQAFDQMHNHAHCGFAKTLNDVDYGGEAAGLAEGDRGLPFDKLKRYPQLQERMWQQFWREFGQGKVAYLEGEDGRPVVKCGADGAAVVYVGQKDFMSVTAQGGQKSNGIKSDAEAEALVRGILTQRKIKGTDNRKPLVAYGKHTKDILRIVKACLNHGLPVRLGSDAVSQRVLRKLSLKDRQEVEGHMAYSDVKGQASIGKDGATPVKTISGQGGKSSEPQPGVI